MEVSRPKFLSLFSNTLDNGRLTHIRPERNGSPFEWLPTITKSPFTRSPVRDLQNLMSWLSTCQESHANCWQLSTPPLPTRVIDVGLWGNDPRLFISNGAPGRYLALSHRWGAMDLQRKMLVTTGATLPRHLEGIALDRFPATFRQAIEVCRALKIQYIWIDSLCIAQDDVREWETEAAKMGDIYANAYATLFAERASHSDDGLLQTEDERASAKTWIQEMDYRDAEMGASYSVLISSGHSHYPNSLEGAFCLVDKPESYLQDRGWVMQEEILSRRKICFSATELHWQCNYMAQCECGMRTVIQSEGTQDATVQLLYIRRDDGSLTKGLTKQLSNSRRSIRNKNRSWQKLVHIYTRRDLTNERDRLSALAGIASMQGRPAQDYLAGIWRQDAAAQLLWRSSVGNRPCRRHPYHYAPTWSWASVTGAIHFLTFSDIPSSGTKLQLCTDRDIEPIKILRCVGT
jgi:Heterokaryon incompatibility protein (HET)